MISDGLFNAQIETIEQILRKYRLFEERQRKPDKSQGASAFRGLSYNDVYQKCIADFVYDFRLSDQSLLLFRKEGRNQHDGALSYSYYDPPKIVPTYEEFVISQCSLSPDDEKFQTELDDWGDSLRDDYDNLVDTTSLKSVVTPIRYDFDADAYRSGSHPASHVHFGFDCSIRVGTRKVLNPLGFLLFILRQHYPKIWELVKTHKKFAEWTKNVRSGLDPVDAKYWSPPDEDEHFLF